MSYSSAAQLEVSSASVKRFMKKSTQEWARGLKSSPSHEAARAHSLLLALGTVSFPVCERTRTNALPSRDVSVSHLWHILLIAND